MKKIYKKLLIVIILVYFVITFISQQKELNTYKSAETNYSTQLEEAKETKSSLTETKNNITSINYIEQVAREKLGMYLPNERVYIDIDK